MFWLPKFTNVPPKFISCNHGHLALQGQATTLEHDKLLPSVLFQLGATLDEMLLNPLGEEKKCSISGS
jgi:hypothetical protein